MNFKICPTSCWTEAAGAIRQFLGKFAVDRRAAKIAGASVIKSFEQCLVLRTGLWRILKFPPKVAGRKPQAPSGSFWESLRLTDVLQTIAGSSVLKSPEQCLVLRTEFWMISKFASPTLLNRLLRRRYANETCSKN